MLVSAPYPLYVEDRKDGLAEEEMNFLIEVVNTVRTIRGEMNIKPNLEINIIVRNLPAGKKDLLSGAADMVRGLARAAAIELEDVEPPRESAASPLTSGEVIIPLAGIVDFREEVRRLEKELARLEKEIARYEKKLGRPEFVERAPKEVVEKDRRVLAESLERRDYLRNGRDRVLSWLEG